MFGVYMYHGIKKLGLFDLLIVYVNIHCSTATLDGIQFDTQQHLGYRRIPRLVENLVTPRSNLLNLTHKHYRI